MTIQQDEPAGRTALVTGASRGIGRATAEHFRDTGWQVYAGVRSLGDAPPGTTPVRLDVTDAADLEALPGALPDRLDLLVNNAGGVVSGPLEALGLDALREQLDLNVVGQVGVTQAALPAIRRAQGRILFVSSISGRLATPMMGAYSASKFAVEAVADAFRVELRPWRIPVVCIAPGAIDTDLWRTAPDTVGEMTASLRPEHQALYAKPLRSARGGSERMQKLAAPTATFVKVVERAATARRPRARYLVGKDAKAQIAAAAVTPQPIYDAVVARVFGLTRAG